MQSYEMSREQEEGSETEQVIVLKDAGRSFRKLNLLGEGSVSECYRVIDEATKKEFACKVIPVEEQDSAIQEHNALSSLSHPNVVKIECAERDKENFYFILELCCNGDLFEYVTKHGRLDEIDARGFLHQILVGCQYLHSNNIIHHDLKLNNIFLDGKIGVKIGDFGLAANRSKKLTGLIGTPNYLAPEMFEQVAHTDKVDIWAIGVMLYFMLFGKGPFQEDTVEETYDRIQKHDLHFPDEISACARDMIEALLSPKPSDRPTIEQLLRSPFIAGEEVTYEVKEILGKQKIRGRVEYLIRWKGYDESSDSWEPAIHCDCQELIAEFEQRWRRTGKRTNVDRTPLARAKKKNG